ncbi:carboxymuconolactone decarboxylase family protein [Chitinophaga sp. sic0106]|uniref:carboxymuconolactone decarboxylase family protein n=1 Tax=Chitinophaga sp. sic0106 TaxID=2854785 RepID=UPI001C461DBC|nr:carboxymuconolactone decarboxylase family protein [Chitinophaga sp. sic0106]MBV7529589.1 carboxymuconolactone decarboxylase family protein [Chitinophaga sp. sic0106]
MEARIKFEDVNKGFADGLFKSEMHLKKSGLDPLLKELIKFRASLINDCAFCLDMHWKDAIHLGEKEQRLYSLGAWRECPYYSDVERAVLAYTEEVTAMNVSDETYNHLTKFFDKAQIADITLAIVNINSWNMLNRAFHTVPGGYVVGSLG